MDQEHFLNDAARSVEQARQYAQRAMESYNPADWQTAQAYLQQAQNQWNYAQTNYHQLTAEQWQQFENAQTALDEAKRNLQQAVVQSVL